MDLAVQNKWEFLNSTGRHASSAMPVLHGTPAEDNDPPETVQRPEWRLGGRTRGHPPQSPASTPKIQHAGPKDTEDRKENTALARQGPPPTRRVKLQGRRTQRQGSGLHPTSQLYTNPRPASAVRDRASLIVENAVLRRGVRDKSKMTRCACDPSSPASALAIESRVPAVSRVYT